MVGLEVRRFARRGLFILFGGGPALTSVKAALRAGAEPLVLNPVINNCRPGALHSWCEGRGCITGLCGWLVDAAGLARITSCCLNPVILTNTYCA